MDGTFERCLEDRAESEQRRLGVQYTKIANPELYTCRTSGFTGQVIIAHEHADIERRFQSYRAMVAAREQSPPASQDELESIRRPFEPKETTAVQRHLNACRACETLAEMHAAHLLYVVEDPEGGKLGRGISEAGEVVSRAPQSDTGEPLRQYGSFEAYWSSVEAQPAESRILPFSRRELS